MAFQRLDERQSRLLSRSDVLCDAAGWATAALRLSMFAAMTALGTGGMAARRPDEPVVFEAIRRPAAERPRRSRWRAAVAAAAVCAVAAVAWPPSLPERAAAALVAVEEPAAPTATTSQSGESDAASGGGPSADPTQSASQSGSGGGGTAVDASEPAEPAGPAGLLLVAVPHPDDEFQAWALIEDTPRLHKAFVVMTRGEQAGFCDEPAWDEGTGELRPMPWPQGRWTESCEQARVNSFFGFMEAMGADDPGLPESYEPAGTAGPLPDPDRVVCRLDGDHEPSPAAGGDADSAERGCITDRAADVRTSPQATVIWFNLGDGDLTADEADWAITAVIDAPERFGLPDLPFSGLVGASWYNGPGHTGCGDYAHRDHGAIADTVRARRYDVAWQALPTCRTDPAVTHTASVTHHTYLHAFAAAADARIGAHPVHYGWLASGRHGYHDNDYHAQDTHFHRHQHYWIRHNTGHGPGPAAELPQ